MISFSSGRMRTYNYEDGKGGDEFEAARPQAEINSPVVFSTDGKRFASAAPFGERGLSGVRIHHWPSGRVVHSFVGRKTLASGSRDTTVLLWDLGVVEK